MTNLVKNYLNDESGATAIEYGLIAALVGIAMITGATALGTNIEARFQEVATELG